MAGGGQTYHLLLGGDHPSLVLKLGAQDADVALDLGGCLLLILRQRGLQPLVLLLQLVAQNCCSVQCLQGPLRASRLQDLPPIGRSWWRVSLEARQRISRPAGGFVTKSSAFQVGHIFELCLRRSKNETQILRPGDKVQSVRCGHLLRYMQVH
jgi:hypothetical protein